MGILNLTKCTVLGLLVSLSSLASAGDDRHIHKFTFQLPWTTDVQDTHKVRLTVTAKSGTNEVTHQYCTAPDGNPDYDLSPEDIQYKAISEDKSFQVGHKYEDFVVKVTGTGTTLTMCVLGPKTVDSIDIEGEVYQSGWLKPGDVQYLPLRRTIHPVADLTHNATPLGGGSDIRVTTYSTVVLDTPQQREAVSEASIR